MFVNYVNGVVTINTFRKPSATATTINDLMSAMDSLSIGDLAASVSDVELANPEINKFVAIYENGSVDLPIEL